VLAVQLEVVAQLRRELDATDLASPWDVGPVEFTARQSIRQQHLVPLVGRAFSAENWVWSPADAVTL
jgi:hypothetical protein